MKLIRQACWVLLLTLYAAAALKVDSFHELFHARELKELHSPEQENNPCHKSIYHQESKKGCEHKSHITENTKCPLCEFNVAPDHLADSPLVQRTLTETPFIQIVWCDATLASIDQTILSRGPPANV